MADEPSSRRATITIRSMEGRAATETQPLSDARYQEQVQKLVARGISVPVSTIQTKR